MTKKQASERADLIRQLEQTKEQFEHQALMAIAGQTVQSPLTMQQLRVLSIVAIDQGRATAHAIAPRLQVSVATVSGLIDRLVDHGVIIRTENPDDRRVRLLSITAEGRELISMLLSTAGNMPEPVLEAMDLDDLRALVRGVLAVKNVSQRLGYPAVTTEP